MDFMKFNNSKFNKYMVIAKDRAKHGDCFVLYTTFNYTSITSRFFGCIFVKFYFVFRLLWSSDITNTIY